MADILNETQREGDNKEWIDTDKNTVKRTMYWVRDTKEHDTIQKLERTDLCLNRFELQDPQVKKFKRVHTMTA